MKITDENIIFNGDCLEIMPMISSCKIDLILCDLPYGVTANKWDVPIQIDKLWEQYKRLIKPNGTIILTAVQPFASLLITSNLKMFKYELIWDKVNKYTCYQLANHRPLCRHENILVFSKGKVTYNKQYRVGKPYIAKRTKGFGKNIFGNTKREDTINNGNHNPCSIIEIKGDVKGKEFYHPTEKNIELLTYLIKTYSNEGDLVMDNCMGSGSTCVAAKQNNRTWIGIEKEKKFFDIASRRLTNVLF